MNFFASPTLLEQVQKCERCTYDQMAMKLKKPREIMASLPNGMDAGLKAYTDKFRGKLPPELEALTPWVIHPDGKLIDRLRQWNGMKVSHVVSIPHKDMQIKQTLVVQGGIDELLQHPETGEVMLIDFKTKATEPPLEYAKQYYQQTMETYAWMLTKLGYTVAERAYLWYWWPVACGAKESWKFQQKLLPMTLDPSTTERLIEQLAHLLPATHAEIETKRPAPAPDCEMCTFIEAKMLLGQ